MVNNDFNSRIVESVRNRIVMSNLEREEKIKLTRRKKILSLVGVMFVVLTGGFATVNAVTNGELVNKVLDTVNVIFIKDGNEKNLGGYNYTDSNNHEIVKYELEEDGSYFELEVDKTALEENEFNMESVIDEDGDYISIKAGY